MMEDMILQAEVTVELKEVKYNGEVSYTLLW